jgi:hypothetical protein
MNPSFDVPADLLDNGADFSNPFFAGLKLRRSREPLVIGKVRKDYLFPTLYADVRCAQGIFHCSFDAALALLGEALGPGIMPPRMLGGRTIVAVSCYEYRKVRGVRPYNEIAIALPMRLDGKTGIPVLGAFAGGSDAGYYIACMPVTSDENRMRGHHFWNLPKITRRIDIEEMDGLCRFDSFNEGGGLDISLAVPTGAKSRTLSVKSFLATKKEGRIQRNPTAFEGEFAVRVDASTLFGRARPGTDLALGAGEASDILRRLSVEKRALQTRYVPSMNSFFDLPAGAHEEA